VLKIATGLERAYFLQKNGKNTRVLLDKVHGMDYN
jgi:hypothetical protein